MVVYTNQVFLNRWREIVQTLVILKFEPDLYPKPERLSEHGVKRSIISVV